METKPVVPESAPETRETKKLSDASPPVSPYGSTKPEPYASQCPNCHGRVHEGKTRILNTATGFGFAVCDDCYTLAHPGTLG
jgi:hypothetical protein